MRPSSAAPILLWFRRDLRLDDNLALTSAVKTGQPVVPIYILDPEDDTFGALGSAQSWWLHHTLDRLQTSLKGVGSSLVLRRGKTADVLRELARETGANRLFVNRCLDPQSLAADAAIGNDLGAQGIGIERFGGQLLHDPETVLTGAGGPYRVYTPFWNALSRGPEPREPVSAPGRIAAPGDFPRSDALDGWRLLPSRPNWAAEFAAIWEPGEAAALEKLEAFAHGGLNGYRHDRDFPAKPAANSMLSPHLAFGEISPFRVWHATRNLRRIGTEDLVHFRKELVWREFCYHLLFHFPNLATKNWNGRFDSLTWRDDDAGFKAWTRGVTGFPIVDAGMRQLWRHGIMHNRVRMITASFLIKDLLVDWQRGERWFRDTLVDADRASNAANWQWVAGTGADASPFFRVFNPVLQGEKFDAGGGYVRMFVPEIAGLPDKYLHRPFEAPAAVLREAGVTLGKTYPHPVVDHAIARDRALAAYAAVKG